MNLAPVSRINCFTIPKRAFSSATPQVSHRGTDHFTLQFGMMPPENRKKAAMQKLPGTLYFYRKDGPYGCLSNFAPCGLGLDGKHWRTVEHYYQAQKFVGIDNTLVESIRNAPSAIKAFHMAHSERVKHLIRPDWTGIKVEVMRKAVLAKFQTNPVLTRVLLGTHPLKLVEDSPNDTFWGCGSDKTGQNMLGKLLMEIRDQLREAQNHDILLRSTVQHNPVMHIYPPALRKLTEQLSTADDGDAIFRTLSAACQAVPEFQNLGQNQYFYRGYLLEDTLPTNANRTLENLEIANRLYLKSAPVLVECLKPGNDYAIPITYWPGCEKQLPVPYNGNESALAPNAKEHFLAEMEKLAEIGYLHRFAAMGRDYWFINPTSGHILLKAWDTLEKTTSPTEGRHVLETFTDLLNL